MSDYCLDCYNKFVHKGLPLSENDVIFDFDICDGCKQNLPIVKQIIKGIKLKGDSNE